MCNGNDKALPSARPRVFSVLVLCFFEVFIMSDSQVTTISLTVPLNSIRLCFYVSAFLSVKSVSCCCSVCLLITLPGSLAPCAPSRTHNPCAEAQQSSYCVCTAQRCRVSLHGKVESSHKKSNHMPYIISEGE